MVKLPDDFVATKYPGYFFNTADDKLYSLKIDGVLKPLKHYKPNFFNHLYNFPAGEEGGYQVSVNGRRRWLLTKDLDKLTKEDSIIPVKES